MKIWCLSDSHCQHFLLDKPPVKDVDMVIVAGDVSNHRELSMNDAEMRAFIQWFDKLPYKYKIYVPGNHDTSVERNFHKFPESIHKLVDRTIEIEGYKIFGSPYSLAFGHGWAYNMSHNKAFKRWELIKPDTDIVITHGPPKGILDYTKDYNNLFEQCGDKNLLNKILEVQPKLHVFGHLHDESGVYNSGIFHNPNLCRTQFINASVVDLRHNIVNSGYIIEI